MPEDRWVEPRARIPLAGIVAIVLIVAVVAVFLKTQLGAIFPTTTVQVTDTQGTDTANIAGRASSTFEGLREIALARKERLEGVLQTGDGARVFTVDVPARTLAVTRDGRRETFPLELGANGALTAVFELDGVVTRIDVAALDRTLTYSRPGVSANPIAVPLVETLAYEGFFEYHGERLLLQYLPGQDAVRFAGAQTDLIPVATAGDGTLAGVWTRDDTSHPVRIDLTRLEATVADVW